MTTRTADLWLPPSKTAVVDELVEALAACQSVLLTGEPGVGKTRVLRALRRRLPEAGFRLTYCHNATLGRRDFYRHICLALGLNPKAAAAVFYEVTSHVEQLATEQRHPVFLLDEAHLLHQDVLDHLHILCNYEWDSRALLSLLLVGLPELRERLSRRHQRSLYSRIHHRLHIEPTTPDDTADYVRHRLRRRRRRPRPLHPRRDRAAPRGRRRAARPRRPLRGGPARRLAPQEEARRARRRQPRRRRRPVASRTRRCTRAVVPAACSGQWPSSSGSARCSWPMAIGENHRDLL